ncbi:MAG TPA: hypothetical protein VE691_10685, partial [Rubrobacter sp.]|nr:hypothetical protein [Rubrobacter sp.]
AVRRSVAALQALRLSQRLGRTRRPSLGKRAQRGDVGLGGTGKPLIGGVTRIAVGTLTDTRAFLVSRSLERYRVCIKES